AARHVGCHGEAAHHRQLGHRHAQREQSAACGTAVCSGGDAEVKATLSQAGVPLTGRTVRFDIVSGDVGIITSAPGLPETTGTTATATTDSTGTARIRIRVSPN